MVEAAAESQALRDLLWVVNSPSFVAGDNVAPQGNLALEEIDGDDLATFLAPRQGHRVGHYFEDLLHYWLCKIRRLEMVGAGLQVRDGKRTIGEIDFLYRDEVGVLTHCEASVKFFLHHPRPDTSDYPGPNATDNFERKVSKLFSQQLELSRTHYPAVVQRHAFVKGIVFYRSGSERPSELPERMPSKHLHGSWYRPHDIDAIRVCGAVLGAIANKPHWLAPCPSEELVPIDELCDQLGRHFTDTARSAHPVMLSLRDECEAEIERAFVVSDSWPTR